MPKKRITIKPLDVAVILVLVLISSYLFYRIKIKLHYNWNWAAMPQYLFRYDPEKGGWVTNILIQGLLTTIRLSVWGAVLASVFGTVMGLCRVSGSLFLRMVSRTYVEFIRNMPPLVLIFIFYFFIGDQIFPALKVDQFLLSRSPAEARFFAFLFGPPAYISNFLSGLLALALFEGAYITEIVRAGIQSMEKGQWEAARALGLSRWQQMRHVILPQATARILPPLAGQYISLIKDSSIVSIISIQELTFKGTELMAATYFTIEIWIIVAALYLSLTLTCSFLVGRLELHFSRGRS